MEKTDTPEQQQPETKKKKKRKQFTAMTKKALLLLLEKNYMVSYAGTYRIRDKGHRPLLRIHKKTFTTIFPYIRKSGQFWVIALQSVRSLKKNTWLKRQYLKLYSEKKEANKIDEQLNINNNGNIIQ